MPATGKGGRIHYLLLTEAQAIALTNFHFYRDSPKATLCKEVIAQAFKINSSATTTAQEPLEIQAPVIAQQPLSLATPIEPELEPKAIEAMSGEGLALFQFESHHVRILTIDGQPWFVAKDLCDVLELGNSRQAVDRLDDDEKGVTTIDTLGGTQGVSIVSESGMSH